MIVLKIEQVTEDATLNLLLRDVNTHMQQVNDRREADHLRELEEKAQIIKSLRGAIDWERGVKVELRTQLDKTTAELSLMEASRDDYARMDRMGEVNLFIVVASVIVAFVSLGFAVYSL